MSVPKTALTEGETFQLRKANKNQVVDEWTLPLDTFLKECVVRNYFNFDMVAIELNQEAKRIGHDLGAARTGGGGIFTADKCRSRWSYIHLLVSLLFSLQPPLVIAKTRKVSRVQQTGHFERKKLE